MQGSISMNKKLSLLFPSVVLLLLTPVITFAADIVIPVDPSPLIISILTMAKNVTLTIAGGFIIIMFVFAGFKYLTARGNPQQVHEANKALLWALAGVAVIVLAWAAVEIVANSLGVPVPAFTP